MDAPLPRRRDREPAQLPSWRRTLEALPKTAGRSLDHGRRRDRTNIIYNKSRRTTTRGRAKSMPEMVRGQLDLDPTKLVFVDETGASTNLARKSGRCRRGRRLRAAIPHSHYKTVTLVAGLRLRGLTAARTFDGPINAALFEHWWRHASSPRSRPARSSSWTISRLTRGRGSRNSSRRRARSCDISQPTVPDMNPIEKAFFKLKAFLRKFAERTVAGSSAPSKPAPKSSSPRNVQITSNPVVISTIQDNRIPL